MIGEVRDEAAGVLSRLGGDRVLEGEGECVFQVGQFGGAEFAGIVDQHDGPLAEQVVAPVNVLNNPVDRTVAVLATLGLPDVNLRLLVRGVAKHHVDTGLAHVLVHTEVTDLPSGDDVESVGHVRRGHPDFPGAGEGAVQHSHLNDFLRSAHRGLPFPHFTRHTSFSQKR